MAASRRSTALGMSLNFPGLMRADSSGLRKPRASAASRTPRLTRSVAVRSETLREFASRALAALSARANTHCLSRWSRRCRIPLCSDQPEPQHVERVPGRALLHVAAIPGKDLRLHPVADRHVAQAD